MTRKLAVMDVGRMGYAEALELQFSMVEKRQADEIEDTLILVEHPEVITMGRSATESDVLIGPEQLRSLGVEVFHVNRGGEVTYHGPGQLVGYLIINLYNHQRKLKKFVGDLEEVFVRMLAAEYNTEARHDDEHRGVWVGNDKITAIGIAIKNAVTMHGFAFNVNVELDHFGWIVPCGIKDRGQTSLQALLGRQLSMDSVKAQLVKYFCDVFQYEAI
ncbi:MAG TPA: lipoyl(octanoyl) transferase LipB [Spirochaetia bacterium]|nr:lipoyl(octanoyl) transferase LipB [Spirochaetia bacterium]